jgi:DNA-binding response OmpR family regulator
MNISSVFNAPPIVLVVDNSTDTLNRLYEGFNATDYVIFTAENATEALKHLEHIVPDAILIDAVSSDIGGFELARRVRATPKWADVPVLFMVEQANTDQIIRSLESGGNDYLPKPLRIPEVLARLGMRIETRNSEIREKKSEAA